MYLTIKEVKPDTAALLEDDGQTTIHDPYRMGRLLENMRNKYALTEHESEALRVAAMVMGNIDQCMGTDSGGHSSHPVNIKIKES